MSQRKKIISKKEIYLINSLFYDQQNSEIEIRSKMKNSIPLIQRNLCITRREWEILKPKLEREIENDDSNSNQSDVSTGKQ